MPSWYAFGRNVHGELGIASAQSNEPQRIQIDSEDASEVLVAGAFHALVIGGSEPSKILGWGLNAEGQLGLESSETAFLRKPTPALSLTSHRNEGEEDDKIIHCAAGR